MQKNAIRIVAGAKYNSHTEPLFKKLQILPLPDLISFNKIQFMQRFTQQYLPESFNNIWVRNSIRNIGENEIQLRNADHLQIAASTLTSLDIMPLFDFPRIWQSFPDEQIKILRKKIEFDTKLKKFFIDDLSENVNCNRLFCPACSAGQLWKNIRKINRKSSKFLSQACKYTAINFHERVGLVVFTILCQFSNKLYHVCSVSPLVSVPP